MHSNLIQFNATQILIGLVYEDEGGYHPQLIKSPHSYGYFSRPVNVPTCIVLFGGAKHAKLGEMSVFLTIFTNIG